MPYRVPGEVDETGEVVDDDVIDPTDPNTLTLAIAQVNPRGYAARFALLSPEKQAAWLGRVSVKSLITHFTVTGAKDLRMTLDVRDERIIAHGFAQPQAEVTFVKAVSLVTQTARVARAVGLPFVLDVSAVLTAIWRDGAKAVRATIPDLEPHSLRLYVEAPYVERGAVPGRVSVDLEWSSTALGGAKHWAVLANEATGEGAQHDANADAARRRAKKLAAALDVDLAGS